jgi:hypothetical protein
MALSLVSFGCAKAIPAEANDDYEYGFVSFYL